MKKCKKNISKIFNSNIKMINFSSILIQRDAELWFQKLVFLKKNTKEIVKHNTWP